MFKSSFPAGIHGGRLTAAEDLVFIDHQALKADRTAGVDFTGADTDFRPEAETETVAETVEQFQNTPAASTRFIKRAAAPLSSVIMESVCPDPYVLI